MRMPDIEAELWQLKHLNATQAISIRELQSQCDKATERALEAERLLIERTCEVETLRHRVEYLEGPAAKVASGR